MNTPPVDPNRLHSTRRTGVLVLNLGTPDSPEPEDVGRYLSQFLMDKWVIDIPFLLRWILVRLLIVPKRKFASSHAYKQVWSERGSPLAFNSKDFVAALQKEFPSTPIVLGMRYGNPSVYSALEQLKAEGAEQIVVFSQYPQYAESSTVTAEEECRAQAAKLGLEGKLKFIPSFYAHPAFIRAYAAVIRETLPSSAHLLLSYHGLPERHIKHTDLTGNHCFQSVNCCDSIKEANKNCYRAQCFATTRALAKELGLAPNAYTVSFQSRLGRTPWIKPFTDFVIKDLPSEGKKNVVVVTPSFTADCLETVEEIGIRAREDFKSAGGQSFARIPCLNAHPGWIKGAAEILREYL